MQIKYVKTIVGWYNIYNVQTGEVINVTPEQFAELCPGVSRKSRLGCLKIDVSNKKRLFAA
ncbi:hypothetical protein [Rummeliibacillus suwonensis]|uniref:hypothetical protein n=1 Tax=Rummeliibacillus suwonensis TaxID=1306154 RepID=UPI0011B51A72|nr:hypothetical protein [Rummeliibacillus suwonensis]